jgi:hemoglobin-like flavoprotein
MGWQAHLLEQSVTTLAPVGKAFSARFYETLFLEFPNLMPLFHGVSMKDQHQKLWSTLTVVAQGFRHRDELTSTLLELGAKHKAYGVRPQDYDTVRVTLLKTLQEFLGESWSTEMQLAWSMALYDVSQVMLQGAHQTPLQEQSKANSHSNQPRQERKKGARY